MRLTLPCPALRLASSSTSELDFETHLHKEDEHRQLIADGIVLAAHSHAALKDALIVYEQACRRLSDKRTRPDDRVLRAEIHAELVIEIHQPFVRLDQQENTT